MPLSEKRCCGASASEQRKFSVENLSIVSGCAPEACLDLPAPSHAFIGGSSGNMKEIITLLLKRTPPLHCCNGNRSGVDLRADSLHKGVLDRYRDHIHAGCSRQKLARIIL